MFIEAGIYGPASLDQILRGKHMKRAMEAYMTIYLALYILYIKQFLCKYPDIDDKLKSIVSVYLLNFENKSSANSTLRSTHDELINDLSEAELFTSLQEYDDSLTHQAQFLRNFMAMYEILLLFTRATRQGNWILHLSAIDLMIPYFFVHDLYNYARLMPEYLAQMHQLKEKDPDTWRFLEGNFSVNKSVAAFSAIGADHGIEQENRAIKVLGGVKGLLLNKAALYRFGIVAPELNRICDEFCLSNDVTNYGRTHHYQLSGSMNARVMSNITKLSDIFETYDVNFDNSQSVYNLVSKAVLSDKAETDLLNHRLIGEELYKTFVNERITGEISIWSKMKKRNLLTFKSAAKTVKTKLEGHVVELKEDRALMQRILVVSQKRPEVDLPKLIGQYEFSVTPRSLFSFDGKLLPCNDKSKLLHVIEDTANKSNTSSEDSMLITTQPLCSDSKVVIFDGMALVNQIVKTKEMKTCKDLSDVFVDKLIRKGEEFTEIRLVFDRYMEASLKEQTREKRTSGRAIRYIIKDSTSIVNITLKQLLSHIETKKDLTAYLAQNTLTALTEIGKRFVVTSDTECVSNIPEYPENLRRHNQEEADTLILLQAKNVSESNPYSELVVVSPDTDVFLLLIHFYPELCKITTFRTGTSATLRDIDIRKMYEWLGSSHAEALLSFHVFTGCDQTGRFFGKSKTECFKIFLDYDSNDLESLKMLGSNNLMPTDELIAGLEKFVLDIYCKRRPDTVNSIPLLRWHLFSKNQKSSEMLPPTSAALRFKILRSHYVTYILRNAMDPFPQRPDPVSFGWSLTGNMLMPTATDQLPAPTDMVELVMCGCKTNCTTNRCKCKKHDLICTDMCQCHTCENVSGDTQELDDDLPSDFELEFSDNDDEDN